MNVHATGVAAAGEFTLCGLAAEGEALEGGDSPPIFACPGEIVTCDECRRIIEHCRHFIQFREPQK